MFFFVDASRLFVKLDKVVDVVWRKREYQRILASIDNRCGLAFDFLRPHKIGKVLGDDDLHSPIFSDTFCHLRHEIKRDWIVWIDEKVRLVNRDDDFTIVGFVALVILGVEIFVVYDFVVQISEHQKHLGIGEQRVVVGKKRLKIEADKVFVGFD